MALSLESTNNRVQSHEQISQLSSLVNLFEPDQKLVQFLVQSLDGLNMKIEDMARISELSPYLILDGHRTGIADYETNPARGYAEGAMFSLRFASIMQKLGGKQATFLIHTLRNYQTMDRMRAIFQAVNDVVEQFITEARKRDIRLQYYGHEVHNPEEYDLGEAIIMAEELTSDCNSFDLNFLTNYSQDWGRKNFEKLDNIPEISVIGRFTKGHYSGAGIPGHANKANFVYIQQASVNENWSDHEIILLILSLLKSHIALHGFVGGKNYREDERKKIREERELELYEEECYLSKQPRKQLITFSPKGPIIVKF